MKRILLIDPYFEKGLKGFPLGLAYIAAVLENDYYVSVLDLAARAYVEKKSPDEILREKLVNFMPDIVGITSTSPTHRSALEAASIIKSYGNIPIIKGGPHETNAQGASLKKYRIRGKAQYLIDYSVVGEGEETIVELVNKIVAGSSAQGVKGVVFREQGKIVDNGRRDLISCLDSLPMPARHLFYMDARFDEYYKAALFRGKKSTSIMTSRGCPFSCTFCSSVQNWRDPINPKNRKPRQRSVESVIWEIEYLYSKCGFKGFMFEDDMSIFDKEWFLKFAKQLQENGLNIEYSLQTRADKMDDDIASALADSGCVFVYFGIESGVQEILDKCKKGINLESAAKAFHIARKYGIRTMASVQIGLPGEDLEKFTTINKTIKVLNEKLRPDEVALSLTCLYPGSELAVVEGVTPEMYEDYSLRSFDEELSQLTAHGSNSIHTRNLEIKLQQNSAIIKKVINLFEQGLKDILLFKPSRLYNI